MRLNNIIFSLSFVALTCSLANNAVAMEQKSDNLIGKENKLNPTYINDLAIRYEDGNEVKQDFEIAFELYKQAADLGYSPAQWNTGRFYEEGKGVTRNILEAANYYKLSADQEFSLAVYKLKYMMQDGFTFDFTPEEAERWYDKINLEHDSNNHRKANLIKTKEHEEKKPIPVIGPVVQFPNLFHKFIIADLKARAYKGDKDAQYQLGSKYYEGNGIKKNITKAIHFFECSANQGDSYGQYSLGQIYKRGRGGIVDYNKAINLFTLSANQGNAYAQYALGRMYQNGQGVKQDYEEAIRLFKLAAEQGFCFARTQLESLQQKMMSSKDNNN